MRNGYRIVDADRHVIEPVEMWREYLEPEHRGRAPTLEILAPGGAPASPSGARAAAPPAPTLMLDGQPVMVNLSARARIELASARQGRARQYQAGADPIAQLRAMDASGIDVSFLYPTFAMYLLGVDTLDAELAGAFARAYNRWLRDFCSVSPERLRAVGLVSPHDPAEMVRELEHVAQLGWRAVVLRPNPVKGRLLSDPAYEPFWAACARRGIAVAIHEGTHARLPTAGADRFKTRFALHACSHPMEQMMAFLALVEGGVLERHPGLRVAFIEAGCGWLPYWLWRLDEVEYAHLAGEVAEHVRMPPSEYFRRQCFISAEPDEPLLPEVVRDVGGDHLLFGTDFPHLDHEADIVDRALALRGRVSEEALGKMLGENAARFFGLDA
ncbi:amidohydrolase family protein [Sorangium sp. So ce131]|uniref:amidohydrolase family protein n=1 Tax=Sorangium sp. So ce131 TaxID=3133282 RepID=UPI003F5EC1C9